MTLEKWLTDTAERAGVTLVQVGLIYLAAATSIDGEFWRGLLVACVTAAANVVLAAATAWVPPATTWGKDTAFRVVRTFVVTIAGSLVSVEWLDIVDVSWWKQVGIAAGAAVLAVVKAAWARRFAGTISPASLAPAP